MDTPEPLDLGGVRITRIVESQGPLLKPAEIFPDSSPEIIEANKHWLAPAYYDPPSERCIIWNEPTLRITWPLTGEPIVSAKDACGERFS
jgi:hypothetical protein